MPLVSQSELITAAIAGAVVSFPTDTVPALAVKPEESAKIYQLKQRSLDKPLILMVASPDEVWPYIEGTETEIQIWKRVMAQHWPGELTLVLPASSQLPLAMNPLNDSTLGVRMPNQALALEILSQTGPLATTSANRSGEPALQFLTAIADSFPEVLTLNCANLENIQPIGNGQPSTVAQWINPDWKILRPGRIIL
jgi:L-threonylcarbamoyladenylate synthase